MHVPLWSQSGNWEVVYIVFHFPKLLWSCFCSVPMHIPLRDYFGAWEWFFILLEFVYFTLVLKVFAMLIWVYPSHPWASLVAQLVKNLPAMQETWVWSLGWEDPLEEGKATHSSILGWTIQSMGSQRVGHDWVTFTFTFFLSAIHTSSVSPGLVWVDTQNSEIIYSSSLFFGILRPLHTLLPPPPLALICRSPFLSSTARRMVFLL